jgi:hypothetical protein
MVRRDSSRSTKRRREADITMVEGGERWRRGFIRRWKEGKRRACDGVYWNGSCAC